MGYAVIMFIIMLLMAFSIALSANYGISKDGQKAPLLAENAYAERETGKVQTDIVIDSTKINGTAFYTNPDGSGTPNFINLYLKIINNGSIVLDPREYSIILNRSWVDVSETSDNLTSPLENSTVSSLNLSVTPTSKPMSTLSLTVITGNGIKIITPNSTLLDENHLDVTPNGQWWDVNISWPPAYGEIWPIDYYTVYWMNSSVMGDINNKNNYNVAFRTYNNTNYFIGQAFPKGGTPFFYIWVTATDTHGNEGPPSNTCTAQGSGAGTKKCNVYR